MVGRSDVDDFDLEEISLDNDDSASNLSEPRQLRRGRRKAKVADTGDEEVSLAEKGRQQKRSKRIIDKEREEFLSEFDQTTSERERRKKDTKHNYRDGINQRGRQKAKVYDERGILVTCRKDLCDCMDDTCPGCHFPCPKCRSNKCGHECRQNRKWIFDCVELDGVPGSMKENSYAKDFQSAKKS